MAALPITTCMLRASILTANRLLICFLCARVLFGNVSGYLNPTHLVYKTEYGTPPVERLKEIAQSDIDQDHLTCFQALDQVYVKTDPLFSGSNSSCHVKDQCPSPQFHVDPCAVMVPRAGWGARATRNVSYMYEPVSIVFIHHTAMDRCYSSNKCIKEIKNVQDLHMDINGWDDIGYSFLVGEDGRAYEARGWDRVGAHTLGWNDISISISVMGNFNDVFPRDSALRAINSVIECGLRTGKIMPDYRLYGHRDARPIFDSPGHMLYSLVKTWPHYSYMLPDRQKKY
ncbi:hypothetical protein CHS0354_003901 [Potamilus streckersoni]|uniref:Peptidoglycan recognition protein n=1 Tax=Potamilus streckersoni TaxID=2493646 RepID=A0AAE0WCZ8_9BIVA|nr:hypothetical protein CHS0354_003901 [Potamilus streckersoni]